MQPGALLGRTILLVEDDYFLAQEMVRAFERSGVTIVGPVSNVGDALDLLARTATLDGAVLDVNLQGEAVYPVADALSARDVPFVFATGYDAAHIALRFRQVNCFQKPIDPDGVVRVLFARRSVPLNTI